MNFTSESDKPETGEGSQIAGGPAAEAVEKQAGHKWSAGVNLGGVLRRMKAAFGKWLGESQPETIENLDQVRALCQRALTRQGEVSSIVIVARVADAYQRMEPEDKLDFFKMLAQDFPVDASRLETTASYTSG